MGIEFAKLEWKENSTPFSSQYQDVYYSKQSGIDESRYVFLEPNRLIERWKALPERGNFTVGELGFGTGLNFFLTAKNWLDSRVEGTLFYYAVEKNPLSPSDFARILDSSPDWGGLGEECLSQFPLPLPGFHELKFQGRRVVLRLLLGDVEQVLEQVSAGVDAWYFDGFAPSRNPGMWTKEVFERVQACSQEQATFSTFTASANVRRTLRSFGFDVRTRAGFGKKREMLCGRVFSGEKICSTGEIYSSPLPWFRVPRPKARSQGDKAIVIGGGLAGTSIAASLAQRGLVVDLIERESSIAARASGNASAIYMPHLSRDRIPLSRFSNACFSFFQRQWADAGQNSDSYREDPFLRCGVLSLFNGPKTGARQVSGFDQNAYPEAFARIVSREEAESLSSIPLQTGGLFFSGAGSVDPRVLCRRYLEKGGDQIRLVLGTEVHRVCFESGQWSVYAEEGGLVSRGRVLVLANAMGASRIADLSWLPLLSVRGQMAELEHSKLQSPQTILHYDGYLIPNQKGGQKGGVTLGATFDRENNEPIVQTKDNEILLARLFEAVPHFCENSSDLIEKMKARAEVRCTSPDKLPLIGPVPDVRQFCSDYDDLHHGRPVTSFPNGRYLHGLYLFTGLGSRGVIYSALGAELLAAQICGEPMPLERDLVEALNPARFIIRKLRRRI